MEFLRGAEVGRLLRDEVVGSNLLAEQPRHTGDDLIAQRMPERVVVPLERREIDQPDRAPAAALIERQERFQLLDEAAKIHQPRLRVTMGAVGEVGDELLEVPGDAADRGVARRQLLSEPVQTLRKPSRDRLNRVLLRLLGADTRKSIFSGT